jgi:hypothetical protein
VLRVPLLVERAQHLVASLESLLAARTRSFHLFILLSVVAAP